MMSSDVSFCVWIVRGVALIFDVDWKSRVPVELFELMTR
jgi:hypothetical protein